MLSESELDVVNLDEQFQVLNGHKHSTPGEDRLRLLKRTLIKQINMLFWHVFQKTPPNELMRSRIEMVKESLNSWMTVYAFSESEGYLNPAAVPGIRRVDLLS